jgi:hypothetical protein
MYGEQLLDTIIKQKKYRDVAASLYLFLIKKLTRKN